MIPLRLSFKGLYSYQKETVIDFGRLTEGRLFGIFGPVGSGKSSILEAITYALYGDTERLNQRDNRGYNMMNLKAGELKIEFEFLAGRDGDTKYKFTVSQKRNSKRHWDVGSPQRMGYEWVLGAWVPLESSDASHVLGLSYDHFIKTIIIPQGRFQDFLTMTTGDRTKMLKDIFELHKFDLSRPTGQLLAQNKTLADRVEGELAGLPVLGEGDIAAREAAIAELEAAQGVLQGKIGVAETALAELVKLKDILANLEEVRSVLDLLEPDEAEFEGRARVLDRYKAAQAQFQDLFAQEGRLRQGLAGSAVRIAALEAQKGRMEAGLTAVEDGFKVAQAAYEEREGLTRRAEELRKLAAVQVLTGKRDDVEMRWNKGNGLVAEEQATAVALGLAAASLASKIADMRAGQPDGFVLGEVRGWLLQQAQLAAQVDKERAVLAKAGSALQAAEAELALLSGAGDSLSAMEALRGQLKAVRARMAHLHAHARLAEFAAALKEGDPCPLCGAESHPTPFAAGSNAEALVAVEGEAAALEAELDQWAGVQSQRLAAESRRDERAAQVARQETVLSAAAAELEAHRETFRWAAYAGKSIEVVDALIAAAQMGKQALDTLEAELDAVRRKQAAAEQTLQQYRDRLRVLEQEKAALEAEAGTLRKQVVLLDPDALLGVEAAELEREAAAYQAQYEAVTRAYQMAVQALQAAKDDLHRVQQDLGAEVHARQQSMEDLAHVEARIEQRRTESTFATTDEVRLTLALGLNAAQEEKEIAEYKENLKSSRDQYARLTVQVAGRHYDPEAHAVQDAALQTHRAERDALHQRHGELRIDLEHARRNWARRRELEAELGRLKGRGEILATMEKLFRANGFVDYVSSVYLRELANRANERFRKLTRNRLSLEVAEDNSFIVRDMVNGGQTRSVKTLSGGQTFQAALSLALALADNIQQRNRSTHNFFFLDEGFGSLDRESLQVVFDTLKELRRENRVVGVISHVEELQQEIDTYLRIHQDDDQGSVITASWATR